MLNFSEIKTVRITDVCTRYGVQLRCRGDWASAVCPLPTHKAGDKEKTFSVNIPGNYWKCWSGTCNDNNGGKRGGDVINLVALLEGCTAYQAAQKLADWYHLAAKKNAPRMEERSGKSPKETFPKDSSDHNPSRASVKAKPSASTKGYMAEVDGWFDQLFTRHENESDEEFRKRFLNGVKSHLIQSYKAGQQSKAA